MLAKKDLISSIERIVTEIGTVRDSVSEVSGECIKGGKAQTMFNTVIPALDTVVDTLEKYAESLDNGVEDGD